MSSIRSTVAETLSPQYMSYAEPVITALEARETAIKEGLTSYAVEQGLTEGAVTELFIEVGLSERAETTSVEGTTMEDVMNRLDEVLREFNTIKEAARRQGLRV